MKSRLFTILTIALIGLPLPAAAFDLLEFGRFLGLRVVSNTAAEIANATFNTQTITFGEKEDPAVMAERLSHDADDMNQVFDEWTAPFPESQRVQEREKVRATFSELFFDHPSVQDRLNILREMSRLFDELVVSLPEDQRIQAKSKLHTRFSELFLNHPSVQERLTLLREEGVKEQHVQSDAATRQTEVPAQRAAAE